MLRTLVLISVVLSTPAFARCTEGSYINVSGHRIHNPECVAASVHLQGETAICRDGSHSLSEHHRGTCSHHGGVARFE